MEKMEKMEKETAVLWTLLEKEKIFLPSGMDFMRLCNLMGVDGEEMDRYLLEELGFSGEQIFMAYRKDYAVKLKESFGIVIKL